MSKRPGWIFIPPAVLIILILYNYGFTPAVISDNLTSTSNPNKDNVQFSAQNIPKSCQELPSPKGMLPAVPPSERLKELNSLGKSVAQDDQRILSYIWDNCATYMRPPDGKPSKGPSQSMGQVDIVLKVLNNKKNGFFVECGALDGVVASNTMKLEKDFGWTGLLVEADPTNIKTMHTKFHRNAWISQACMSTTVSPMNARFRQSGDWRDTGKIQDENAPNLSNSIDYFEVQCFPFYSFMSALNIKEVDYFSLDIEGHELKVLKTIPFDKIFIKVISVEFLNAPEGQQAIKDYVESQGYKTLTKFSWSGDEFDLIFIHKSLEISKDVQDYYATHKVG